VKFLTLILSVYFLSLSFLTCSDDIECNVVTENSIQAITDHTGHEHEAEHCTPICVCACCGISVINLNETETADNYIQSEDVSFQHAQSPYLKELSHTIWHPPKIS
jgi:hypothetical protein